MQKTVDHFFESEKTQRIKMRKVLRNRIQKVHNVLYKYSHEKMGYFMSVPELCQIYLFFYEKGSSDCKADAKYCEALEELKDKSLKTLNSQNWSNWTFQFAPTWPTKQIEIYFLSFQFLSLDAFALRFFIDLTPCSYPLFRSREESFLLVFELQNFSSSEYDSNHIGLSILIFSREGPN